jgi:hypothetical protein
VRTHATRPNPRQGATHAQGYCSDYHKHPP